MLTLRKAKPEELDLCVEILGNGRDFQRQQGFMYSTSLYH